MGIGERIWVSEHLRRDKDRDLNLSVFFSCSGASCPTLVVLNANSYFSCLVTAECSRKQEDSDSSATAVTGSEQKGTLSIDEESCSSVSSFSRKSKVDGGKNETDEGQNKTLDTLDESIDRVASLKTLPLSFTRSLKGTLNKLTRDVSLATLLSHRVTGLNVSEKNVTPS